MGSMAVLPNRFLVKLDAANDWFKTYQHPLGILRLTVDSAENLGQDTAGKSFFKKLIHDVPDCFVNVTLGETWKTKTVSNERHPKFNETHDFIVCDHDQNLGVEVVDADTTSDDALGKSSTNVKELLLAGEHVLSLTHNGAETDGKVKVRGEFLQLVADPTSLNSQDAGTHGLLTVLVASVLNISDERAALKPSVAIKWGQSAFRTGVKSDSPGSDIQNPTFDVGYTVPLSATVAVSGAAPVRLILMDGEKERGFVDVPLQEVLAAPELTLQKDFALEGDAAIIRAAVILRGTKVAA
jgi:Ca2+-dependent lipid-binding protein